MARTTNIPLFVNGEEHMVSVRVQKNEYIAGLDGVDYCTYNTAENSYKNFWLSNFFPNEDFPIIIYGETYIISVRGSKIRLAKDNRYIDTGEEFTHAQPMPKWYWVFFALNIALVLRGGAIGGAFGGGGAFGCAAIAAGSKNTAYKVIVCTAITLACWAGAIFVAMLLMRSFYT